MKNSSKIYYAIIIIVFILIYLFLEYALWTSRNGSGLGVYLIYIGTALGHLFILLGIHIVKKIRNQVNNNFLFFFNAVLALFILFRLFFLV